MRSPALGGRASLSGRPARGGEGHRPPLLGRAGGHSPTGLGQGSGPGTAEQLLPPQSEPLPTRGAGRGVAASGGGRRREEPERLAHQRPGRAEQLRLQWENAARGPCALTSIHAGRRAARGCGRRGPEEQEGVDLGCPARLSQVDSATTSPEHVGPEFIHLTADCWSAGGAGSRTACVCVALSLMLSNTAQAWSLPQGRGVSAPGVSAFR